MLRVDGSKPCSIVYSVCKHDFLGFLIEPHIVQLNADGDFSLTYQRIFSNTASEFESILDTVDLQLIRLLEEIEQSNLIKRFHKKAIRPVEFFSRVFDEKFYDVIRPKIEKKLAEALELLKGRQLFLMSKEGWPVGRKLHIADEAATVLFHFKRNPEGTRYYPTIKYQGYRIEFMFKDAQVISNYPAWLLLEDTLYYFEDDLEGKKLQPFLNKRFIAIPKNAEKAYFEKFVGPLIEKHSVHAEGFEIKTERYDAIPVLKIIFPNTEQPQLQLYFRYGDYIFPAGSGQKVSVRSERVGDSYTFHRIKRSMAWEKGKQAVLVGLGLKNPGSLFQNVFTNDTDEPDAIPFSIVSWLNHHHDELTASGFEIEQADGEKRFVIGQSKIDLGIREDNDWFDIEAIVHFGPYQVPFIELKNHILARIREFKLPSGEIAVIPEEWFARYSDLLQFSEGAKVLRLKKHHIGLVTDYAESELASLTIDRKLQKLADFREIENIALPTGFNGLLRPYQQAGYNWFHFLRSYNFGGCLADDMGLGKTVQTLALLQKVKEEEEAAAKQSTSLIIMPTSLVYNWMNEAAKFTPGLRIHAHVGTFRNKDVSQFLNYDVVITTYGITRVDIELLKSIQFQYIILDESQNIKNSASKSFRAVRSLRSKFRLILSGTPVENSVNDLWTQMSFINPGLLGNQNFFYSNYVVPIEKKKDDETARKLQSLIKPFVLRRTKAQVATELPEKTENVFYCEMSDEQREYYEKTKSEYRNILLEEDGAGSLKGTQIDILQGLTKLRQIANHPRMIDNGYEGDSGKFESVVHTLEQVLSRGHKVLVFSQFVKQLDLFRQYFDGEKIPYTYLDGATKHRAEVVDAFQTNEEIKLFLISIKAGGVGLNLTEADYVFILDPWWNPAVEQQAIDRTHRIGQTKNVFIYKFITRNTVEEKILALQGRKRQVAESLITTEDSFVKSLTQADIADILS